MSKTNYFKGWYFKCSSNNKTIAFIQAYHRSNGRQAASLQIITDEAVYNIPFDSLEYSEKPLCVNIGNHRHIPAQHKRNEKECRRQD